MAVTIKLKNASGSDPSASDLVVGEVALRTDSGKLFTKKDDNSIVQIGGGAGAIDDGAITNAKVASDAAIQGSKISPDFGSQDITTTGHIDLPDNSTIKLGTGDDLEISHSGNHSFIKDVGTGSLFICSNSFNVNNAAANETIIKGVQNGAVELYHDNSKKFETTSAGVSITGTCTLSSHLVLGDSDEIKVGSGEDLLIFHDGSNSFLQNSTGELNIRNAGAIKLQPTSGGENAIVCNANDSVELYHDNSKKIETTSAGIDVTGNITATGTEHKFTSGTSGDCEVIIEADTDNNNENDNPRLLFRQDGGIDASCVENGNNKLIISNSISNGGISFKTGTTSGYTNATERLSIAGDGTVDVAGNLDVGAGIDVTGNITATGTASTGQLTTKGSQEPQIIIQDSDSGNTGNAAETGISFRDGGGTQQGIMGFSNSGDQDFYFDTASTSGEMNFRVGGSTTQFKVDNSGIAITGNIVVSGNVDGRNVASDGSKLDGIASGATNVTNTNQLTNGAGFITATLTNEQVQDIVGGMVSGNTESGITVTYQDSDGTLDFSVASQTDQNFTTTLKNKLDGIASGATNVTNNNQLTNGAGYITSVSGQNYNSLSNLPTIPSNNNQLSNGAGYITSVSGQNYNSLSNLPTIPSNNNQLSNGAGYITSGSNRAAQAWVNFRGTSSVSIRDDVNVSQVDDDGTGLYTVHFSSNMPNGDYCVATGYLTSTGNANAAKLQSQGAGSFQIRTGSFQDGSGNNNRDFTAVYCAIFAG